MRKFKITPEAVTGNTAKELETDIESIEKLLELDKTRPMPRVIKELLNEILEAKKIKLEKLKMV